MIAASQLENALGGLLRDQLPNLSNTLEQKLFGRYGPLATFSAKIDIAYAMGKLTAAGRQDLHAIRNIRNAFAHASKRLHFRSDEMKELLRKVRNYDEQMDPYALFIKKIDQCWDHITFLMKQETLAAFLEAYRSPPSRTSPKKSG